MKTFLVLALSLISLVASADLDLEAVSLAFEDAANSDNFEFNSYPYEIKIFLETFRRFEFFEMRPPRDSGFEWLDLTQVKGLLECAACRTALTPFILEILNGTSLETIQDQAVTLCKNLQIEKDPVCEGAVDLFGPYLYNQVVRMGENFTADLFCGMFLDEECFTEETADTVNSWTVDLPSTDKPEFVPPPEPAPDAPKVKVLHFTDVHLDLTYLAGSNIDCGMPCCCMASTGLAGPNETAAPYWGTYGGCDMPLRTLEAMFAQISRDFPNEFAYAIFTGDAPAHDVWAQTKESNLNHMLAVINAFKNYFPDTKLFITLGNHEGIPVNVFPTSDVTDPDFSIDWLYNAVGEAIEDYLTPEAVEQFKVTGSYAIRVDDGLKLINLNNNFGASMNFALWNDLNDPEGALAWLVKELQESEDLGEKVHINTHHPGRSTVSGWAREYRKVLRRYENTIRAVLVGHTHSDEMIVILNEDGIPTGMEYINPSFTSRHSKMPEFRVFTFDGGYPEASWQLLDIDTYFTPLEEFIDPEIPPEFQLLYNCRQEYGLNRLLASDWLDLYQRAATDDDLLDKIVKYQEQNWDWVDEKPEDKIEFLCNRILTTNNTCPIVG